MKRQFFNPAHLAPQNSGTLSKGFLPKMVSRRMPGAGRFASASYRSDGETSEPSEEAKALIAKVNKDVKDILEAREGKLDEKVKGIVTGAMEGLPIEALRNFKPDELKDTVNKLAGQIEKMEQRNAGMQDQAKHAVKALLADENTWKLIERAFDKNSNTVARLNLRAALPVMGITNVVNDGDIPEDILNSFQVTAFAKKRRPNEYIFEIASRSTVADVPEYITWLEEGNEEGAFAIVEEGAVKPLVSKTLVRNVTKYKKIAGKRVYTEEFAKFRKEAYRILEELFNDQLMRNYAALLVVDLDAKAASYTGTSLDGQYTAPTDYHAIGAVAAQIETLNFYPDLLIINPQDKWRISLQQNTQGSFYLAIPTYDPNGVMSMMGFRVFVSNRVPVGTFYLGESGLYKIIDEAVKISLGYGINVTKDANGFVTDVSHDFDNNRFRIISEFYYHSYIASNHVGSFVKATFADVKEALQAP